MNVHSTVFHPTTEDGLYMVVASAMLPDTRPHPTFPMKRMMATTLHEAIEKCCQLACEVQAMSEKLGHRVVSMRCSHCPTRYAPKCGVLAR